ncbi:DUF2214 family protein [Xanthomonas sacchari]
MRRRTTANWRGWSRRRRLRAGRAADPGDRCPARALRAQGRRLLYLHTSWFWAKLGTFAAIGLISLVPTLRLLGWRRQARLQPTWSPNAAQVRTLQRLIGVELGLLAVLVVLAAAMARYGMTLLVLPI